MVHWTLQRCEFYWAVVGYCCKISSSVTQSRLSIQDGTEKWATTVSQKGDRRFTSWCCDTCKLWWDFNGHFIAIYHCLMVNEFRQVVKEFWQKVTSHAVQLLRVDWSLCGMPLIWRLNYPFAAYSTAQTPFALHWARQPPKIVPSRGGSWPSSNTCFLGSHESISKLHLDRFSRFRKAYERNQQTDKHTTQTDHATLW